MLFHESPISKIYVCHKYTCYTITFTFQKNQVLTKESTHELLVTHRKRFPFFCIRNQQDKYRLMQISTGKYFVRYMEAGNTLCNLSSNTVYHKNYLYHVTQHDYNSCLTTDADYIKHSCKVLEHRGYIIIPSPCIAFHVQCVAINSRPHQCRIVFHKVVRSSKENTL